MNGFHETLLSRQECLFQRRAGGNRSEGRGDANDRTIEIVQSGFLNFGRDLSADAALFDSFMGKDKPRGFLD